MATQLSVYELQNRINELQNILNNMIPALDSRLSKLLNAGTGGEGGGGMPEGQAVTKTLNGSIVDLNVEEATTFVIGAVGSSQEVTVSLSGAPTGMFQRIYVLKEGTGPINWNTQVKWANGKEPTYEYQWTILMLMRWPGKGWYGGVVGDGTSSAADGGTTDPEVPTGPDGEYSETLDTLVKAYITDTNGWEHISDRTTLEWNKSDMQGGNNAVEVTVRENDNHQIWYDLDQALIGNEMYNATVDVYLNGPWTGDFDFSYYDDGTRMNEGVFDLEQGWQTLRWTFYAQPNVGYPRLRLIGWDEGTDGESLTIGMITLKHANVDTTARQEVDLNNYESHLYSAAMPFSINSIDGGRDATLERAPQPYEDETFSQYLDRVNAGDRWGEDKSEIRLASQAPFNKPHWRCTIPANTSSPSDRGAENSGTGWEARFLPDGTDHAIFKYQVKFMPDFDWVKGGKLPGLYGGTSPSGGADPAEGFTSRMMWRADGQGELYGYFPNKHKEMGDSIARGAFKFTAGVWQTIEQEVKMNTIDADGTVWDDGYIRIWFNGEPVFQITHVVLRIYDYVHIDGVMSTIFFGGTGEEWRSPQVNWIDYGDYELWIPAGEGVDTGTDEPANPDEPYSYIPNYVNSAWFNTDPTTDDPTGTELTYDIPDAEGISNGTRVTFRGDNQDHHVWYDFNEPLVPNRAYILQADVKKGPTGFSGQFEMAYYDGSNVLAENMPVYLSDEWTTVEWTFFAGYTPENDASIRLIGWGQGLDGESVDIGEVRLINGPATAPSGSNLLAASYIYASTPWEFLSGTDPQFGVEDEFGGTGAVEITMVGADTHHIEHPLDAALEPGVGYRILISAKKGWAGFSSPLEIAYYVDNEGVRKIDVELTDEWQEFEYRFFAPASDGVDPKIRLIGFDHGLTGETVVIGRTRLERLTA